METPLTQNIKRGEQPLGLADYQKNGGYEGLKKALKQMAPADVLEEVKASNVRGRGGAGFPTGLKWSFVPMGEGVTGPKYIVANGDEMEPGAFKDRYLCEGDPHQFIEGMIIAAYTLQANTGYIFLRSEYTVAADRLNKAIQECKDNNLLGNNILKSNFSFKLYVHASAGRYICGEETALLNSLEGKRANPRAKPPFPQVSGLWGKPTIVNNVETFCNIPHIIKNGADWFKGLGQHKDSGTKIFGLAGRVKNPGCWELPMGIPVAELIEKHAGGMQDGYSLKAWQPGGGSTDFLTKDHLDIPFDFDGIAAAGSRMGTGTMTVIDDKTCLIGYLLNLEQFFAQESCGWCTPCRDGLPWVNNILEGIQAGKGENEDLNILQRHTRLLGPGSTFCALAPGAMGPLGSALKLFHHEFEHYLAKNPANTSITERTPATEQKTSAA